jgi:hypothetical protein
MKYITTEISNQLGKKFELKVGEVSAIYRII